jgi:hypothetical protein
MVGLSLSVLLALGSTAACSSDKVDGENKGGTGAVLSAGSGGASAGTSNNGGTANSTAGTSGSTAGSSSSGSGSGGSSGSGGTAGGLCAGKSVSCVDAMTAKGCDPETGMDITGNCAEEFAKDGIVSNGCATDAEGTGCTVDDFTDMGCLDGTGPFAACEQVPDEQVLSVYVACFHDVQGLHAIIPCFANHVDETTTPPTVDCDAAYAACVPGAGGAPAGAGGAP